MLRGMKLIPIAFDQENCLMHPPNGMTSEEIGILSACLTKITDKDWPVVITCWKLTKDELEEINKTGRVWLTVLGARMQPVEITVKSPFIP